MRSKFGALLRQVRRARDVTAADLAKSLGTSTSYVSQVELGLREPLAYPKLMQCLERLDAVDRLDDFQRAAVESHRLLRFELGELPSHVALVIAAFHRAAEAGRIDEQQAKRIMAIIEPPAKKKTAALN